MPGGLTRAGRGWDRARLHPPRGSPVARLARHGWGADLFGLRADEIRGTGYGGDP